MVVGVFETGIPRLCDGKYLSRGTHKTLSQKGNVAPTTDHAGNIFPFTGFK